MTTPSPQRSSISNRVLGLTPTYQIYKNKEGQADLTLSDIWRFFDRPFGVEAKIISSCQTKRDTAHFIPILVFINFKLKKKLRQNFKMRFPCLDNEPVYPFINQILAFHEKYRQIPWDMSCSELDLESSIFGVRWVIIQSEDTSLTPQEFFSVYSLAPLKDSLAKSAEKLPECSAAITAWHESVKTNSLFILPSLTSHCEMQRQATILKGYFQDFPKTNTKITRSYRHIEPKSVNRDIDLKDFLYDSDVLKKLKTAPWIKSEGELEIQDSDEAFWERVKDLDKSTRQRRQIYETLENVVFLPKSGNDFVKGWFGSEEEMLLEIDSILTDCMSSPHYDLFVEYLSDFS